MRTVVLKNPWERDLLGELVRRLPCVVSSEQAILRSGASGGGRLPALAPAVTPAPASSPIFCRRRADATYSGREQWLEDYRRCMAGE